MESSVGKASLVDFIRCRSICSSWFSILRDLKPCSEPQIPWLILPLEKYFDHVLRFLDNDNDKMYKTHLPELNDNFILGSSDGWMIVKDSKGSVLQLLNPFTKAQIQLPSINAVHIVHLSISSDNGYIVVVNLYSDDYWFVRSGVKAWTRIDFLKPRLSCWRAALTKSLFYVMDNQDQVLCFDLSSSYGGSHPHLLPLQVPPPTPSPAGDFEYLVVSPGSEQLLLLQVPIKSDNGNIVKTFGLDHKQTIEVTNMGGHSLFLMYGTHGLPYTIVGLVHAKGLKKGN